MAVVNADGVGLTLRNSDGTGIAFQGPFPDDLVMTTAWPGGCVSCRFTVKRKVLLTYPDLQYATDLMLTDAQGVFWRGKIEKFRPQLGQRSESIEVEAVQVNLTRRLIQTITITATTTVESAFATVLSAYMPKVTTSSLAVTGRALAADLTLTKVRAANVFARLCELGDSSNNMLGFGVWPDGAAGAYQLVLASRPTTPDYRMDASNLTGTFGFDGATYANRQQIEYSGGAFVTVDDATAQGVLPGGVNEIIDGPLISRTDLTSSTDATAVATTALQLRKQLKVTAESGDVSNPWGIVTVGTSTVLPVALWRVRAGKTLAVDGILPGGLTGTYTLARNLQWIVGTSYSFRNRVLTLTFEDYTTTQEGVIARQYVTTQT